MLKEFETMALSIIYMHLPPKIQRSVMLDILNRCGFKFSLEDLTEETKIREPPKLKMPIYKPKIHCPFCGEELKEVKKGEDIPKLKAKLYDEHLPNCPVWKVYEKHRVVGRG